MADYRDVPGALALKLFFLTRLLGLAMIVDGLAAFFSPFRPQLALQTARLMARLRLEHQEQQTGLHGEAPPASCAPQRRGEGS